MQNISLAKRLLYSPVAVIWWAILLYDTSFSSRSIDYQGSEAFHSATQYFRDLSVKTSLLSNLFFAGISSIWLMIILSPIFQFEAGGKGALVFLALNELHALVFYFYWRREVKQGDSEEGF